MTLHMSSGLLPLGSNMNSTGKADVGHDIQHRAHQAANLPPNLDYRALLVLEGLV